MSVMVTLLALSSRICGIAVTMKYSAVVGIGTLSSRQVIPRLSPHGSNIVVPTARLLSFKKVTLIATVSSG